jgi:thiol-disulfide isomerase/thioredoxin
VAFLFLLLPLFSFAQDSVKVNFFYSKTCPHCAAEVEFLDKIEEKYPEIKVNHCLIEEPQNIELLKKFYQDYSVKREFQGAVPIIFINGEFILGFDNEKGIGLEIENTIRQKLGLEPIGPERNNIINLPFLGQTDVSKYSLPVLAILLGVLDGFNICSLGALVLILGLVLVFKSKRRTLILGGIFL